MTKEEQASQLRLAAGILETGHPWDYKNKVLGWMRSLQANNERIMQSVSKGEKIRIILATPPDNRPLHNPDNLTADQVGVGYRLLLADEADNQQHEGSEFFSNYNKRDWRTGSWKWDKSSTIRLPLSVPWPALPIAELPKSLVELDAEQHAAVEAVLKETILDPYAELKAAHAAGKWHAETEPATKTVDLGPEDVPPGSEIRGLNWEDKTESETVSARNQNSIRWRDVEITYKRLRSEFEINRSIPLTGHWNPTAWEPCHKQIPA